MSRSRIRPVDDEFDDEFDEPARGGRDSLERTKRLLLEMVGRWYWIVFGLILGLLGAGYYLSKAPRLYQATSSLLIKTQTSSIMSRDQVEDIDLGSLEAMNTVAARLHRLEFLERVAVRQDVHAIPGLIPEEVDWLPAWLQPDDNFGASERQALSAPPPALLAEMIDAWLDASVRRNTRLLDLTVTHPVPGAAKTIADAVAIEYLAEMAEDLSQGRSGTIELLNEESQSVRAKLQEARGALSSYTRALEVHQALDDQEAKVNELRRVYLPAHPKMQVADSELERLEERFIGEFLIASEASADAEYWATVAGRLPDREAEEGAYLRMARQQLLARIGVLQSEIDSQTAVFNSMLTRIEESSVNQEAQESSAAINNLARMPDGPSSPNANKVYAGGGVGGLAAGFALAFLLCRLDNKFHTVDQITSETGGTVLAAVSDIALAHLAAARKQYYAKHPGKSDEAYEAWDPHLVFCPGTLETNYAEMYRVLRASVSLLGKEAERKITAFSSALPGEGKTVTSVNFALAAAGQSRRTLLIDLDLRKPNVHRVLGLSRKREHGGITECLAGLIPIAETVQSCAQQPMLDLILSGKRAPNPGELLDTGRLQDVLDWATANYDVVVLDTTPLLAVPDTRIVAPLADNFCLVVRAEYTPKGAVLRVLETLDEDGTALSGLVFNGFKEKRRLIGQNYSYGCYRTSRYGKAYQYGYGTYGAYGSDDEDEDEPRPKRAKNRRRPTRV